MTGLDGLPALDVHAHLAPDVTAGQIRALGHSHTFAVTRSLAEARQVPARPSDSITWGIGVHPGVPAAQADYDEQDFADLLPRFAVVGEIGLDRRAGHLDRQRATLASVLLVCADQPVLLSIHSNGATSAVLDVLDRHPHPGLILHWWNDDGPELDRAVGSGACFSVNAAMKDAVLNRLPPDRVLTETDFPAARPGARRPGDTRAIEHRLGALWKTDPEVTRHRVWVNLRRLATRAEALDRLPEALADALVAV